VIYARIVAALLLLAAVGGAAWKVDAWRTRSAELDQVQQDYATYRTATTKQLVEKDRRERINREITSGYVAVIQEQSANLADAHTRLAGVRVRIGACPRAVPAAAAQPEGPARTPTESADRQPFVVDAVGVADRFAACDAAGARLNSLIEWTERQESPVPP
jgi:hypothetical protein